MKSRINRLKSLLVAVSFAANALVADASVSVIRSSFAAVQVRFESDTPIAGIQLTLVGRNCGFLSPMRSESIQDARWTFQFHQLNDSTVNIVVLGHNQTDIIPSGEGTLFEVPVTILPEFQRDSTVVDLRDVILVGPGITRIDTRLSPARWVDGGSLTSSRSEESNGELRPNFPNPFNPSTELMYRVFRAGEVSLVVYDILGRRVKPIVERFQQAGDYKASWYSDSETGATLPSGTYFAVLTVGGQRSIQKMTLKK